MKNSFGKLNKLPERIVKSLENIKKRPLIAIPAAIAGFILFISACGAAFGLEANWWLNPVHNLTILMNGTPTPTFTATYTPTSTPTLTPTPTATPLEGTPFASDVIGVVLADFKNDQLGVNSLADPLALAFKQQNIPFIRVHHTLADRSEAQQVAKLYNATIAVWGEKYSTGVQVNFEVDPTHSKVAVTINDLLIPVDDYFPKFLIREGMGTLYLLDFTQGQMFYFDHDYPSALDAFSRAVQHIPKGMETEVQAAALFLYRGNTYLYLNRQEEALADFNHALQLNPQYAEAYTNRGVVYAYQERYDEVLVNLNQAIQLDPTYTEIYYKLSEVYKAQGRDNLALTSLNQALQLDPKFIFAYNNRGNVYFEQGKYDLALADYTQALQLDPKFTLAYDNRGNVYYDLGNYAQALADYQAYQQITGKLQPIMEQRIAEMQAALTETPAP